MLPTPNTSGHGPASQETISFLRQSINDNVSTSVPGGNNTNSNSNGNVASGLTKIFGISIKIANSLQQIVANTASIVSKLDTLISFFQDQFVRNEQNQEENRLRPSEDNKDNKKNSNWLLDTAEHLLENVLIKAAVVGLVSVIETLSGDIQAQAKEMVLGYLTFVRKATLDALTTFSKSIQDIISNAGKYIGNQVLSILKKIELPELTPQEISEFNKIMEGFKKGFSSLFKIAEAIINSKTFEYAGKAFELLFKGIMRVAEVVINIVKVFLRPAISLLEEFGSFALKMLGLISRFIGKVLLPLQILLSLIDFINGFIEGYEKSGIAEGVKEGLLKVFDGLVIGIFNVVRDVVSWILDKIGLENTAKSIAASLDRISQDLKNLFAGIIDIFLGIVTLDVSKIWKGLNTGYNSVYDLVVAVISGGFNLVVNFFKDIFGDKITEALNYIQKDLINQIIGIITDFKDGVIAWLKESFRTILNALPGGKYISDKLLGNSVVTPEDIEAEAKNIAIQRALGKFSAEERNMLEDSGTEPKYTITDEDREQAKKNLSVKVEVAPPANPMGNQQLDQLKKSQNEKSDNSVPGNTTNNNVVQQVNNSSKGPVFVLSRTNNASVSTPMK